MYRVIIIGFLWVQSSLLIAQQTQLVNNLLDSMQHYILQDEFLRASSYGNECLRFLDREQIGDTKFQFEIYQRYIQLTNNLINRIPNPDAQKYFYQFEYSAYEQTLNLAYQVYEQQPTIELFEYAFNLVERNRNVLLVQTIRGQQSKQVPEHLIKEEGRLLALLQTCLDSLDFEKRQIVLDTNRIARLEQERDKYQTAYNELETSLNQGSRAFFEDYEVLKIKDLQQSLADDEAFISYFLGKKGFYAFVVNKEDYFFYQDDNEDFIGEIIEGYRNAIHQNEIAWLGYSQGLYARIIAPLQSYFKEKLIVVTDGILSLIPLEGLVTQNPKEWDYNFKELHYLIENHQINYQHSAHIYLQQKAKVPIIKHPKLLAIAPTFDQQNKENTAIYAPNDSIYQSLIPLPTSQKLIQYLKKNYQSHQLISKNATLTNFKNQLKNKEILHFATHTLVDDYSSLESRIALSADTAGHYLFLKDMYELTLDANLVVLGSCSTGDGQYQAGDGVMNMGYGFNFAGVPSLVYALWQVDEKATTAILQAFYKELKTGINKDEALRLAKLQYLKNASEVTADPYYWSGLVMHGNTTGFEVKRKISLWWWVGGGLILSSTILFIYRKRFTKH